MTLTLHHGQRHRVYLLTREGGTSSVHSSTFLVAHGPHLAMIDPGGQRGFSRTFQKAISLSQDFEFSKLEYLIASHQDPDAIAGIEKWLAMSPEARLVLPELWFRFIPHLFQKERDERLLAVPAGGAILSLGTGELHLIPAPFLHSPGNIHLWDPQAKILFSADVGAVFDHSPFEDQLPFAERLPALEAFHRPLMGSRRACRLWVRMVRELRPEILAPHHGPPFRGPDVARFLDWFEELECGTDLLDEDSYRLPTRPLLR